MNRKNKPYRVKAISRASKALGISPISPDDKKYDASTENNIPITNIVYRALLDLQRARSKVYFPYITYLPSGAYVPPLSHIFERSFPFFTFRGSR